MNKLHESTRKNTKNAPANCSAIFILQINYYETQLRQIDYGPLIRKMYPLTEFQLYEF